MAPALAARVPAAEVPGWVGEHAKVQVEQAEEHRQAAFAQQLQLQQAAHRSVAITPRDHVP